MAAAAASSSSSSRSSRGVLVDNRNELEDANFPPLAQPTHEQSQSQTYAEDGITTATSAALLRDRIRSNASLVACCVCGDISSHSLMFKTGAREIWCAECVIITLFEEFQAAAAAAPIDDRHRVLLRSGTRKDANKYILDNFHTVTPTQRALIDTIQMLNYGTSLGEHLQSPLESFPLSKTEFTCPLCEGTIDYHHDTNLLFAIHQHFIAPSSTQNQAQTPQRCPLYDGRSPSGKLVRH